MSFLQNQKKKTKQTTTTKKAKNKNKHQTSTFLNKDSQITHTISTKQKQTEINTHIHNNQVYKGVRSKSLMQMGNIKHTQINRDCKKIYTKRRLAGKKHNTNIVAKVKFNG